MFSVKVYSSISNCRRPR